jgi:hypothetical protein
VESYIAMATVVSLLLLRQCGSTQSCSLALIGVAVKCTSGVHGVAGSCLDLLSSNSQGCVGCDFGSSTSFTRNVGTLRALKLL